MRYLLFVFLFTLPSLSSAETLRLQCQESYTGPIQLVTKATEDGKDTFTMHAGPIYNFDTTFTERYSFDGMPLRLEFTKATSDVESYHLHLPHLGKRFTCFPSR